MDFSILGRLPLTCFLVTRAGEDVLRLHVDGRHLPLFPDTKTADAFKAPRAATDPAVNWIPLPMHSITEIGAILHDARSRGATLIALHESEKIPTLLPLDEAAVYLKGLHDPLASQDLDRAHRAGSN